MKLRKIAVVLLVANMIGLSIFAHSGRTDGAGGHTNHSTGEYHYHHGYPEHQHVNGECPYDFKNKMNENGTSNGLDHVKAEAESIQKDNDENGLYKTVWTIAYGAVMFVGVGLAHWAMELIGSFIDRIRK